MGGRSKLRAGFGVLFLGAMLASVWCNAHAPARAQGWLDEFLHGHRRTLDCPNTPRGPFRLPPAPRESAIGIIFADARPARWDSLLSVEGDMYWSLQDICSALGATLNWSPDELSGFIRIDTLNCRFAVGAEIIDCGRHAIQLTGPVLYLDNRLLMPSSFASRVVTELFPQRYTLRMRPFVLAERPLHPPLEDLEIHESRGRTLLSWSLRARPEAEITSDGAGALIVDLRGAFIDPASPPAPEPNEGACLQAVLPSATGTRFIFAIDPRVVAVGGVWLPERKEYRVTISMEEEDLGSAGFRRWPAVAASTPRHDDNEAVIFVVPGPSSGNMSSEVRDAYQLTRDLGERIARSWEALGGKSIIVVDNESADEPWSAAANEQGGLACICLRPDVLGYYLAPGLRVVSADERAEARPTVELSGQQSTGTGAIRERRAETSFRPWASASAAHADETAFLSELVTRNLESLAPSLSIAREQRPSLVLWGLDMPGVVLYVGRLTELISTLEAERAARQAQAYPDTIQYRGREGAREDFNEPDTSEKQLDPLDRIAQAVALALEAFIVESETL